VHSGLGAALKPLGRHRDDALNGQGQRVIAALHNMMHAAASLGKAWHVAYHDAAVKTWPAGDGMTPTEKNQLERCCHTRFLAGFPGSKPAPKRVFCCLRPTQPHK